VMVAGTGFWYWLLVLVAGTGCWYWLLVLVAGNCGRRPATSNQQPVTSNQ